MAKKGKKRNNKKMKGGGINEETFDTTQVISIVLLAIALVMGILLYIGCFPNLPKSLKFSK